MLSILDDLNEELDAASRHQGSRFQNISSRINQTRSLLQNLKASTVLEDG